MKVFLFLTLWLIILSSSKEKGINSSQHASNRKTLDSSNNCPKKQSGVIYDLNAISTDLIENQNIYGCNDIISQRLYTRGCNIILYGCKFENIQNSKSNGGAIYISSISSSSTLQTNLIEKCKFISCQGNNGGAIYVSSNYLIYEVKLIDNLFSNNQATIYGGAVYFKVQTGCICDCTLINNYAKSSQHDIYCNFGTNDEALTNITIKNNLFEHSDNSIVTSSSMIYLYCTKTNGKFYFVSNTIKINPILANSDVKLVLFDITKTTTMASQWDYSNNCITPYDKQLLTNEEDQSLLQIDFEANFFECKESEEASSVSESNEIEPTEIKPTEVAPTVIITPEPVEACPNQPSGDIYDLNDPSTSIVESMNIYACNISISKRLYTRKCTFLLYGCIFQSLQVSSSMGGAIYMSNTDSTESTTQTNLIEKCQFISCKGKDGGAVYITTKLLCYEVKLINNIFLNNEGVNNGGAVYFRAQIGIIENCHFINNHAKNIGHDVYFEFGSEEITKSSNIKINENTFEHSEENSANSSMIAISCKYKSEKFYFNMNTIIINSVNTNPNVNIFLFNVTATSEFAYEWDYSNNCITPYDEFFITSEEDKNLLKINFEENFHRCDSSEITPTELPPFITLDTDNCSSSHRCYADNKEDKKVFVQVLVTNFTDFINESDGGAIYINNCGFECSKTSFTNCVSSSGGGGGIYIQNSLELKNSIALSNLVFTECKALYGAAIFVKVESVLNPVSITSCKFFSNSIIKENNANELSGGSAILISAKVCEIIHCFYQGNKGNGGIVRILNQLDSSSKVLQSSKNVFLIKECIFEQDEESNSSIYYISGKHSSQLEISQCEFKGKLNKQQYYIDGNLISKVSQKFLIKMCKFDDNMNVASNIDSLNILEESYPYSLLPIFSFICLLVIGISFVSFILIYLYHYSHKINSDFNENIDDPDLENPIIEKN